MTRLPRWRIAAAALILAGMVLFAASLVPIYVHNFQLQRFVSAVTQRVENRTKSDDVLRSWVLDRARQLDLPVTADEVHINRRPDGMGIEIRYFVRVDLPGYTVDLHFHPQAR